ncbi:MULTISPECIES: MbtH family protein [Micromonospora]|uniref:Antibiotic synthesis protein MbtH n=2 Tax=Micromonospora TaxID=1873 RepID=A0A9X0LCA4_9ACTN|nr:MULTISPECIES: MbtH family NRPS accessory protein [Micromonospora]AEB45525.1 MbtH domain protein [Micromonospora maris AB-18-032]AIS85346.1 MbtH domain protein [Verrucosispora sp. MS100047]KUJ44892.1 antibiotic synthesis protein MbtH [Micromonospora maris]RUL95067.1 MbtH family protein [Verrucosispora sp. FIM060022]
MSVADDDAEYVVVSNDEEQFSLWLTGRNLPNGWREAGKRGSREECLAYIEQVWTDMRPRSLREFAARSSTR